MNSASVTAVLEARTIPSYGLGEPERNPMFFEKRVYQGSCGSVYPVPFIDRVLQDEPPTPVQYRVARLENEFVRLEMLPEIGGRIFVGQDKSNDDYDFFYRQDVIKPALVGLAGPWISGGVEFNWPQHHRPSTFMPTDVFIEEESDGARTIWFSEHDPLNRMKGMHGIRLRPNSALIELRGRLYNRTPITRTFLWWANVAAKVHERYQSFFPPDVHYVADHAVRAMSSFPIARNDYYGIDYAAREGANDLSWYKNIPVPTSYMICETAFDFFGGYDYKAHGGFVHVADRHISPGKKQWTWGNDEFGWAWDRELTDRNAAFALGNYAYDKKRRETAIERWEMARAHDSAFPTVHRNLGIAYWNVYRNGERARKSYQRAVACDPRDARLVAEYDQLRAKLTDSPAERLLDLEAKIGLVQERDDATVQLVTLYNDTGSPEKALKLLLNRSFHPWEGGEGKVLRQYTRARLLLGQRAMHAGVCEEALEHFQKAMQTPDNLGEKYHPLQAKADVLYWQGKALRALNRETEAIQRFAQAAEESGDFQKMVVTAFSEMTCFKALALMELGRAEAASDVLTAMKRYAEQEMRRPARIDYFATSLPNLLVFEEDIEEEKNRRMETLIECANKGLDRLSGKRHQ